MLCATPDFDIVNSSIAFPRLAIIAPFKEPPNRRFTENQMEPTKGVPPFNEMHFVAGFSKHVLLIDNQLIQSNIFSSFVDALKSPVWKMNLNNPAADVDVDSISNTVESIFSFLEDNGPSAVDLRGLNAESVNGEHLATVLRITAFYRDDIKGWKEALGIARKALEFVEIDPEDALAGLI